MTPNEETVWLAALLEGEGSFVKYKKTSKYGTEYYAFSIQCNMCDEDVLRRVHEIANVGQFNGPHKPQRSHHSDFWRWKVSRRDHVWQLCLRVLPYMGIRRSMKILEIINTVETTGRKPWRHGTRWGYEGHKCRCDDCRAAYASHKRRYRARKRIRDDAVLQSA